MIESAPIESLAAQALRHIARDQSIKAYIESDNVLFAGLLRAARRYIGGTNRAECLQKVKEINRVGHAATIDYMGEATTDKDKVTLEAQEILELVEDINELKLNSSISLDLSHIGLDISIDTAFHHAHAIATELSKIEKELIISMEGSERTDAILNVYKKLCIELDNVGITLQARLHRTKDDLPELLRLPGKIRLVKGAYEEPLSLAYPCGSIELTAAFREYAKLLIASGRRVSIGTHDKDIHLDLVEFIEKDKIERNPFEFELLAGLGDEQLSSLHGRGYSTRVYFVYGREWYLYLCHRIAEKPERLYQALIDVVGANSYDRSNFVSDKSSLFPHR